MFRGSLPADLQRITGETTELWPMRGNLYVGCSGNLTIERTIANQGWTLHSNDVLLYTSALGAYYAGEPLVYWLSDEAKAEFPWIAAWETDDASRLAIMLLLSKLVETLGKTNVYYERMRNAYEHQWENLFAKTLLRIVELPMKLGSFTPEDVFTWIDEIPKDAPVVMYPPFVGASKAFERDFEKLERMFEWPGRPGYGELSGATLQALYEKIADRPYFLLGVNKRVDGFDKWRVGMTQTTNRGIPIHVYSSAAPSRIVVPRQAVTTLPVPHIQKGEPLGKELSLLPLEESQFSALRSQYMNPHIRPGAASLPLAVLVDGKLIGVFAYSFAPTLANWDYYIDGPSVYLLSDFPVSNSSYKHLAKLVLYAALSNEARTLAERYSNRRMRSLTTTAFAKNPVSMKYRGVFQLLKRKKNEALKAEWAEGITSSDAYYSQPYELQYGAYLGQWSLSDGFALWRQKSGVYDGAE